MKKILSLSALALGLSLSSTVFAETATSTLTVTATVENSCIANTTTTGTTSNATLAFGEVTSTTSNVDADTSSSSSTAVTVLCNSGAAWTLVDNGGANLSDTQRRMSGGSSEYIPYDLYSDSEYANAVAVGGTLASGSGSGSAVDVVLYGRIPAGATLPSAGDYTDTVTLTLSY
jgi:spore coat protein U-like protein